MKMDTLLAAVWEQNRALLVFLGILFLLIIGLFLFQGQVVDAEIMTLEKQQTELQKQLRERASSLEGSVVALSEAQRISNELAEFQALIPRKQKFSEFLGELFGWAEKTELDIDQVSYSPEIDDETGFLRYGLSFSLAGDYTQLKRFIHSLENSQRILTIDRITLAGGERRDSTQAEVRLQIQLSTYFRDNGNE